MAVPIWKDYFVTLGTGDAIQYRIILDETQEVIYSGKAFKRPGEANNTIRINDICADYMRNVLPVTPYAGLIVPVSFTIQAYISSTWTDKDTISFFNDWSYDYDYVAATMGFAFPINGHVDPRMPIYWTGLGSSVTAHLYGQVSGGGDFNNDFNLDFFRSGSAQLQTDVSLSLVGGGSGQVGTAVLDLSNYSGVDHVVIGGVTYKVMDGCAKYALYYVNAFGGWDCFLIEGNTLEADTLNRFTHEVEYDNRVISNRGIRNYVNEITKGFTFQSGWLLNDQGERMHHLINSTFVYLYDIANGDLIPVTIPSTTCEYKTYKNQGNQLVNYTIEVEVAQNRIRR